MSYLMFQLSLHYFMTKIKIPENRPDARAVMCVRSVIKEFLQLKIILNALVFSGHCNIMT